MRVPRAQETNEPPSPPLFPLESRHPTAAYFRSMAPSPSDRSQPLQNLETDAALRAILEGTATATGEEFFAALVQNLAKALGTHGAWVTEYFPEKRRLRALAFWMDSEWVKDYEVDIAGTACEQVIDQAKLVHFPDRVLDLYPHSEELKATGAVSYLGVPLQDTDGHILGHMAVIDRRPIPEEPRVYAIFQIFAARAAAELQRLRAETEVREREEKVARLLGSAMDAIIELDDRLHITRVNPAAEKVFRCPADRMTGQDFRRFVSHKDADRLLTFIAELDGRPEGRQSRWVAGGLTARCPEGESFPAEATLSRFELHRQRFTTLILRNVHDRVEAEQKIHSLTAETELLREELQALHHDEALIGESPAIRQVLRDIGQVAKTDATVLILGETGTGKELVARAIHAGSQRHERPLITVNCAAIPVTLIESELFGHEAGAFTGATRKRDGRFALADKGTLFLDEIGELPAEAQSALLRVLEERQFERVGGTQPLRVDVRVIAATNRDLQAAIAAGAFRRDLFYRLNVFPIELPPLRERKDDIPLLVQYFIGRYARKMGKKIQSIDTKSLELLQAYHWPGNIRELQNVIERSVIVCETETFMVDARWLAGVSVSPAPAGQPPAQRSPAQERQRIEAALAESRGRVAGPSGAAAKLGMPASTLESKIRALKINKYRFKTD